MSIAQNPEGTELAEVNSTEVATVSEENKEIEPVPEAKVTPEVTTNPESGVSLSEAPSVTEPEQDLDVKIHANGIKATDVINDADAKAKQAAKLKQKVRMRNIMIILLVIIIVILLIKFVIDKQETSPLPDNPDIEFEDADYIDVKEPVIEEPENIDIPVITDFKVTEYNPYVNFCNPETNKNFYLQYEIYLNSTDEMIYQSKYVKPGKKFSVDLRKELGVGIYDAYVKVRTFNAETMAECNGVKNNVLIEVQ